MAQFSIRPLNDADRDMVRGLLIEHWGSEQMVTRGKIHEADELPGFIAHLNGKPAGLLTYRIDGDECEIITLNSLFERIGIGTAMLNAVKRAASDAGCKRLWLITTNDNLHAVDFYREYGFKMAAVHGNAIEQSRKLKPEIPLVGINGIPLMDEIEMEMLL